MATNNESKGIFVKTIELIGSMIAIIIFATLLFGIFTSSLERMLWQLFDWCIEILKPIVSILLLFVGVFRGIPLLVSFIESIIEDMRAEREYTEIWERLDCSPTPQLDSSQMPATEPKGEAKTPDSTQSRGESFDFSKYKQGSPEAANAYKNSQEAKENLDKLRTLDQLIEEARKATNNA